jgi:hypothetical protein
MLECLIDCKTNMYEPLLPQLTTGAKFAWDLHEYTSDKILI